jgi:tetratricopeptide (TPR) repeat protein
MPARKIKYNPAFLSDEERILSFAAHQSELELILQVIRENTVSSNQHLMLIGPRGIGKTTLALRAAAELHRAEDLRSQWYPIVFGEESYQVSSPGTFWLEALLHLGQQTQEERWQRAYDDLRTEREDRLRERALGQLLDFADSQNKRLLLVVENLHMLLGDQLTEQDAWKLRDVLLNEKRIMVLGSATNRFDGIINYQKAFYELFRPLEIKPLTTEECRSFWVSVTGHTIDAQHIRPIEVLTGGNPRLLMIVASGDKQFSLSNLLEDLEQWLDDHTDYFKSFLDNLAVTERRAYLALAEIWDPATAREVAEKSGLGVNVASSLLKRLVDRGAVLSVDAVKRKNTYQVAERLYNIYYLMRRHGGSSNRVVAIVRFMSSFYATDELVKKTSSIAREACKLKPQERQVHFCAYRDVLRSLKNNGDRMELLKATPTLFFELNDAPAELKKAYAEEILHSKPSVSRDRVGSKTAKTDQPANEPPMASADDHWLELAEKAQSMLGQPEREQDIERLINEAFEAVANKPVCLVKLGEFFQEKFKRSDVAESAFRKAIALKPDFARAWGLLGQLLHKELKRFPEAEGAYRKAIELDPTSRLAWHTHATILCAEGKPTEAMESAQKYLQSGILLATDLPDAIDLFVDLAASGLARYTLSLLRDSPASKQLEPLIIGIRLFLKEEIIIATEILEVGKDVAKRIEERQRVFQTNHSSRLEMKNQLVA